MGIGGWGAIALKTVLLGPLLLIYSVLFLEIKTFMAPNLLNAAKMHDDNGGSRARFHVNLLLCVAITAIVAIGFTIYLAHLRGGDRMNEWFYTGGPKSFCDTAYRATITPSELMPGTTTGYGIGAGARDAVPTTTVSAESGTRTMATPGFLDHFLLREIADTTGGQAFRATDGTVLAEIYSEIDKLETSRQMVEQYQRSVQIFPAFLGLALLLLLLEAALGNTVLRPTP